MTTAPKAKSRIVPQRTTRQGNRFEPRALPMRNARIVKAIKPQNDWKRSIGRLWGTGGIAASRDVISRMRVGRISEDAMNFPRVQPFEDRAGRRPRAIDRDVALESNGA